MRKTFQYYSDDERALIITNNVSSILIEEQNISSGNFLVFSDSVPNNPPTIEDRVQALEDAMLSNLGI